MTPAAHDRPRKQPAHRAAVEPEADHRLGRLRERAASASVAFQQANQDPTFVRFVRRLRDLLPGDSHFGDPLSLGGARHSELVGRLLTDATRPGVLRELGLGTLQVWQAMLETVGLDSGERELVIAFTDLVQFSSWALEAGDDDVLKLLREVSEAWEPPVLDHAGLVVKRLGDGLMAVFPNAEEAVAAMIDARDRLADVSLNDWTPRMRAGVHAGRPRKVGDDFVGVSVNVAARIAERAKANEILISGEVVDQLDDEQWRTKRKRMPMRMKGTPSGLTLYAVSPN